MGQKIDNLVLETAELTFLAAHSVKEEKRNVLEKASLKINLLKMLIRLANEVEILDDKQYIQLEKELQEIGKMTGGWLRSIKL